VKVQNLVLAATLVAFAAADRARADTLYYVSETGGTSSTFGTVDSSGHTTTIATGINFGGYGEKLMFAPNGTPYVFDVVEETRTGAWGRINPATGAFTQIGDLSGQ